VEHELSWIPHFLNRIDYTYTQASSKSATGFKEAMLPSDYFHRNVFAGFQEDAMGIRDRSVIGADNLLWGSDYPHVESTFPRSRQIIEVILKDCTEEEKAGFARRLFTLSRSDPWLVVPVAHRPHHGTTVTKAIDARTA